MTHLISENLLSAQQFGFISGRSTVTQLLKYLDKCIETIVNGGVVDTVYLFRLPKSLRYRSTSQTYIGKLESYGIENDILTWIKAFLIGCTQVVRVNGS